MGKKVVKGYYLYFFVKKPRFSKNFDLIENTFFNFYPFRLEGMETSAKKDEEVGRVEPDEKAPPQADEESSFDGEITETDQI